MDPMRARSEADVAARNIVASTLDSAANLCGAMLLKVETLASKRDMDELMASLSQIRVIAGRVRNGGRQ